tara:strand:+ start:2607 stop:2936 length:330 start_codon:yes stop_codon:yes gene_type:complete
MIFKKYEFDNKEKFDEVKETLPKETVTDGDESYDVELYSHTIVELGNIMLKEPEFDEDGEITKDAEFSTKYHVDILWVDVDSQPTEFEQYEVVLDNNGVHSFSGINYIN